MKKRKIFILVLALIVIIGAGLVGYCIGYSKGIFFSVIGEERIKRAIIPAGSGVIIGRVVIEDKPLEGYKISLSLDGKRTEEAVTNEKGIYRIPVEPGQYKWSGLSSGWGRGFFRSGARAISGYEKIVRFPSQIEVLAGKTFILPDIRFVRPVTLISPKQGETLTTNNPTFKWEPYPGADHYDIAVSKVTKAKRVFCMFRMKSVCIKTGHRIEETSIKCDQLKDFPHRDVRLIPGREYHWNVTAFNEKGQEISRSSRIIAHKVSAGTFFIAKTK